MTYSYDHDFHIHSHLSTCSNDPLQTTEALLQYAVDNHLRSLCVTDHFWDSRVPGASDWYAPQDEHHIRQNLPLPTHEGIRFLFGCETDLRHDLTLGISPEMIESLDFFIIPLNHFHATDFTIPENASPKDRANAFCQRLAYILSCDLPFHKIGIAHPACSLMATDARTQDVIHAFDPPLLRDLFSQLALKGMGLEINGSDFNLASQSQERIDSTLLLYSWAKDAHCKFYLGSDAHHPQRLQQAPAIFANAIQLLGLSESDKFRLP